MVSTPYHLKCNPMARYQKPVSLPQHLEALITVFLSAHGISHNQDPFSYMILKLLPNNFVGYVTDI